jgi:hypothetical protein
MAGTVANPSSYGRGASSSEPKYHEARPRLSATGTRREPTAGSIATSRPSRPLSSSLRESKRLIGRRGAGRRARLLPTHRCLNRGDAKGSSSRSNSIGLFINSSCIPQGDFPQVVIQESGNSHGSFCHAINGLPRYPELRQPRR